MLLRGSLFETEQNLYVFFMSKIVLFRPSLFCLGQHRKCKTKEPIEVTPMFKKYLGIIIAVSTLVSQSEAKDSTSPRLNLTWGGFIDGQYAYDFNNPPNGDRSFSTQPARSNEFNINLAFIEAKLETTKARSRFALQAGTSVQSNYSSEPSKGSTSGPSLSRHIQEARVGYSISDSIWIDAGIFFAHVGSESWISKDNLVLTRSLVADYSPYYLSGVKLLYTFSDRLTFQLLIVNGWQNISENNTDKTLGTGVEYVSDSWVFAYNTLAGQEVSPDLNGSPRSSEFRHFHNLILKSKGLTDWEWITQFDIGFQKKPTSSSMSQWSGLSLMSRYSLNSEQKLSLRAESFQDLDQIVIVTNTPYGFDGIGGSIGFDQSLADEILWRMELRYLKASEDIFPKESTLASENWTVTTSWALSF